MPLRLRPLQTSIRLQKWTIRAALPGAARPTVWEVGTANPRTAHSARIDPERARFQVIREARRLVSDHPEADFAFIRGRLLETTRRAGARRSSLEFSADDVDEARVEIESFLQPKSRVRID